MSRLADTFLLPLFMKGKFGILMVIAVFCLPGTIFGEAGSSVSAIAEKLDRLDSFAASVKYAVALPMVEDDVVYKLEIATSANPADQLLGTDYLIEWQLPVESGTSEGFTAYFNGHHYRYRDHRLQENHYLWDSIPFRTAAGGIQRNGQFVNLLPFSLASQLREIAADTTYTLTLSSGTAEGATADIVKASRHINGLESQQMEWAFDHQSGRPLKLSILYNPGMLGEQEVNAVYDYSPKAGLEAVGSEEALMARYPDVFEKYRVSNYTVENLRGLPLPGFALPTTTRERYLHNKGDRFPSPVIIAVLDPDVASTESTISTLRDTIDKLPRQTSLLLMFTTNDIDRIEPLTGTTSRPGETLLTSPAPFIRDCGINAYPTILLCNSDATVAGVLLGASSSLADDLLQGAALLR